jgi:signal transduction histidine kinase/CheY-like chemotaxis protein/HAMP domain-containing protein
MSAVNIRSTKEKAAAASTKTEAVKKSRNEHAFPHEVVSTRDLHELLQALKAAKKGDFSVRLGLKNPLLKEIAETFNNVVGYNDNMAKELVRVGRIVGREGRMTVRASLGPVDGSWAAMIESYNALIGDLVQPTTEVARVISAVAQGDLSQKIPLEIAGRPIKGDFLRIGKIVNTMVDQLRSFAAEVIRVAKEVGTEGKLGGQAKVPGVAGTWKDLTDNVNGLAGNLTSQVRNIALVTTAVANGDLSQKITVDAQGEILELKNTINVMVDQLRSFAAEVTRVAKEVGIEGKLGGQAKVPGVAGTWKDLTENVNQLAGNLTSQVRAIAEVSTAVTKGDLTRFITVEAQGEVLALKDNINQMIANLKETTEKNMEQDWLKTNLARFSGMMQGQKNLAAVSKLIMSELTPLVSGQYGAFFMVDMDKEGPVLELIGSYAYKRQDGIPTCFRLGEGLVGQCAIEKKPILLNKIPADYVQISSGLGRAAPANILVLPVLFEGEVLAVIELASFQPFSPIHRIFLDQLMVSIGVVLNIISASMRTEELLRELQNSNSELEAQANELEEKAKLLEIKNHEVELASLSLEEKAEQLAMISKYKSEFLANMSHELRTPLNSLLIMAKLLADNKDNNLNAKQIEFAHTIQASGRDLLSLINEILDLSKVEAGKMHVVPKDTAITELLDYVERDFRPVAQQKEIAFGIDLEPDVPESMYTDGQRLQQILKNLLSNAFKFTEQGSVTLHIGRAIPHLEFGNEVLRQADDVLAFAVRDTGIGIADSKQRLIFEAFQQVDATTSRKYGGTGLGLTISREISRLLGGEIRVESEPGVGSVFTLFIPATYVGPENESLDQQGDAAAVLDQPAAGRPDFEGQQILVVDDDVRNIFAIASLLENHKLRVLFAENGKDAIELLQENEAVDLVLMDVMMPEMDGFETTRAIRRLPTYNELPIIALTAKAMKGDREKCLEAGLSDYITKPVDTDRLLALIQQWLYRNDCVVVGRG